MKSTANVQSVPQPSGVAGLHHEEGWVRRQHESPRNGGHPPLGRVPNSVRHLPRLAQQSTTPFQGFAGVFGADCEAGEFELAGFIDEKILCIHAS